MSNQNNIGTNNIMHDIKKNIKCHKILACFKKVNVCVNKLTLKNNTTQN